MRNIHKSFGANKVLTGVDFTLAHGQIRALLGENGAGKSTLMNILGGILRPDDGDICIDDVPVSFTSPRASLDAGIGFIHQELNLVNDLTVYENMFIGQELKTKWKTINRRAMCEKCDDVFERMGIALNPQTMVRDLDASYKQIVEIARALLMRARIIIMDEPTTSLTEVEIARVFDMMESLARQGVGFVFISHKLREVFAICEAFTVMRDGAIVAEGSVAETSAGELARHMVGHAVRDENLRRERSLGGITLRAEHLSMPRRFGDISFHVRAGEIVGFTGLLGDGRSELFQAIFGALTGYSGILFIHEKPVKISGTYDALKKGIGYVPRNRKENGIIKDLSILQNASIVTLDALVNHLLIDLKRERKSFQTQIDNLRIKLDAPDDPITSLSGGNQQKVVLAKWLSANPEILIFDNPTQGVDVGAKEDIYDIISALADAGVAIIVLSSEAQEIIKLCDRALVMYHGFIQGEISGEMMNEHDIMLLATGGR